MSEVALVSNLGLSPIIVVNILWMLQEEYDVKVSKVILFTTRSVKAKFGGKVSLCLKKLFGIGDVEVRLVNEVDVESAIRTMRECLRILKEEGVKVIVDITAGRKTMSIALYTAAMNENVDLITYVHLIDSRFQNMPVPLIPYTKLRLIRLAGSLNT